MKVEQIKAMLTDIIDNMEVSKQYSNHKEMKHAWLKAVAEATKELIQDLNKAQ